MNITKAKLTGTDSDIDYCNLIIEAEAETQEGSYAKLNIEIDYSGFAGFLQKKYKMWPPDAHSEATNPKREEDMIAWLNETLTFIPVATEKKIKDLEAKIERLEERTLAF